MLNDCSRDSVCAWTPCVSSISISFKHEGRRCVFVFLIWLSIDPERDVFSPVSKVTRQMVLLPNS